MSVVCGVDRCIAPEHLFKKDLVEATRQTVEQRALMMGRRGIASMIPPLPEAIVRQAHQMVHAGLAVSADCLYGFGRFNL